MKRMIDNKDYDNLKNSVDDINTNKLPQYVKYSKENGAYTTYVHNENDENTKMAGIEFVKTQDENNMIESAVVVDETGVFMATNKKVSGVLTTHTLKLDHDGNLTLDGNAVGGGDKLYQHNIYINQDGLELSFKIINTSNTKFTDTTLKSFLWDNYFRNNSDYPYLYEASGFRYTNSGSPKTQIFVGVYNDTGARIVLRGRDITNNSVDNYIISSTNNIYDKVIEL